jgi:hypothetical protein
VSINKGYSQSKNIEFKAAPEKILGVEHPLVGIADVVIIDDSTFAVLTSTFPAIHVLGNGTYRSWGKKGNGPDELDGPSHLEINGDTLFTLDFRPGACKIVSYDLQGKYISSEPIRGAGMCYVFKMSGHHRIVETGQWGSPKKELLLIGEESEPIARFTEPGAVSLKIPKGPMRKFSFQNPFIPQPVWGVNGEKQLIIWKGDINELTFMEFPDLKPKKLDTDIPDNDIHIEGEDVENWLNEHFPADKTHFGKPNFFAGVRKRVKQKMDIPDTYAFLRSIKTDPAGGFWILRGFYRDAGQVWSYVSPKGKVNYTVTFRENREILAFGEFYIVAKHQDKNGIEYIEIYDRDRLIGDNGQ